MATIGETLEIIPRLQDEFENELRNERAMDKQFVEDLLNFTSVYYVDLLAHACIDSIRNTDIVTSHNLLRHYVTITSDTSVYQQYIRWQGIGNIYSIWGVFEQFVLRQYDKVSRKEPKGIEHAHKALLCARHFGDKRTEEILQVFTGIRRTRNSLHSGGIYTKENAYAFEVCGETFSLEPGRPVQPIRLTSVIRVMWNHYLDLKTAM